MLNALLVDMMPWGVMDQHWIKQVVERGEALQADSRVPEPYYALICVGLQPHAPDRTKSVQHLCYTLRSDIKWRDPHSGGRLQYLSAWISSSLKDLKTRRAIAWKVLHDIWKMWKSGLSRTMKRDLFISTVKSILLYGAETWTLTSAHEKSLDGC
ncbi:Inactive serine/threonine-protein kinase TEX14 [Merluccius polli]|uniref:Inactive serine/threonine-protein kinase TEX14 n=1 Tax=Merluccius polli TaxID=89951 RepID=A0AA47MZC8_MERPO|nr:Inactive serine/threonine-protein kinase TEX14 [Merluccius polli]